MELNRIIVKKKKSFISDGWSRPQSLEKFINNYVYFEERQSLISDARKVKFIDEENNEMSYEDGYRQFKLQEEKYLDEVLETQQAYFAK